ncbi:MAG: transferase hexapeptide repeat containing protein [Mucilaginibacter sp.]|nr:transferase hexapeptide repeat containing protein [Mucilaginibacter sp.]
MKLYKCINEDLKAAEKFSLTNKTIIFFFNRGFHALMFYRLANLFYRYKIPVLPAILTRIIQIFYSIDIDYKAEINGGIVIVHGIGLVIGAGVKINSNVILFHGVTLGRRGIGPTISKNDGYPFIEEDCIICTGAMLLGNITIGRNTTIGANCVITSSVPSNSICKIASDHFVTYNK